MKPIISSTGRYLAVSLATILIFLPGVTMSGSSKLAPGDDFPHFSAIDMAENEIDTREYASGKALILDFWSIYCTSCIQEMPHIVALYNKYKDKGLTVLGIDMDAFGTRRVSKFLEGLEFEIPYPNIIDKKREIGKLLGVSMLPTTIVIDPAGKVKMFHVGYKPGFEKELESTILEVLPQ